MLKAFFKFIWLIIYNILEWCFKILYLMLPLGFHIFAVQMRDKINPVTTLTAFVSENSTWTMVYDGVVIVNTNVGAVKNKIKNLKKQLLKMVPFFIGLFGVVVVILLWLILSKLI